MSGYPFDHVLSPPDLPPYLNSICKLSLIVGVPSDEQVIQIHTTIRVANRVVDLQGMGDSALLARLSEHLFNAQMARYRNKYPCNIFPSHTTFTPPTLPVHMPVKLKPISGQPSHEEIVKVQSAIRAYEKLIDIPSLFDPQVNAELSQHLFDVQMARYMERCSHTGPVSHSNAPAEPANSHPVEPANEETNTATNNAGRATDVADTHQTAQPIDPTIRDAIERSNRLIERSNEIAEQLTRAVEQSSQPTNQPSYLVEKVTEIFGRMNEHFEQSNRLAEASMKPVEKLGEILKNINKVLSHKGNTSKAVNCLINEKGNTGLPNSLLTFSEISEGHSGKANYHLPVIVNGISRDCYIPDVWLGDFLHLFGIGHSVRESGESTNLKGGCAEAAREVLSNYLTSRLVLRQGSLNRLTDLNSFTRHEENVLSPANAQLFVVTGAPEALIQPNIRCTCQTISRPSNVLNLTGITISQQSMVQAAANPFVDLMSPAAWHVTAPTKQVAVQTSDKSFRPLLSSRLPVFFSSSSDHSTASHSLSPLLRPNGGGPTHREGGAPIRPFENVFAPILQRPMPNRYSDPRASPPRATPSQVVPGSPRQFDQPNYQGQPIHTDRLPTTPEIDESRPVPEGYPRGLETLRERHVARVATKRMAFEKADWVRAQARKERTGMLFDLLKMEQEERRLQVQLALDITRNPEFTPALRQSAESWVTRTIFPKRPSNAIARDFTRWNTRLDTEFGQTN
ncbi:hypothetical protein RSOL_248940, partial [Rhizoctonia solani AG-3 Rhs1AP]